MKHRKLHRRFLAPQGRRGNGYGYLDRPMRQLPEHSDPDEIAREAERVADVASLCDEPECLTRVEWEMHIDKRAKDLALQQQRFEDAARERARRMLTFEQRLEAVIVEAKTARQRVDISRDVRLLKGMQAAGKSVRHLEQRLFTIERKVFSKPEKEAA